MAEMMKKRAKHHGTPFILVVVLFLLTTCGMGEPESKSYFNVSPFDIRGEIYITEIHWAGSIDNYATNNQPMDNFIELHNNAPVPYDLSGWCIRFTGKHIQQQIIIPRGPESIIAPNKYYTIGWSTDYAFTEHDLVLPDFFIPGSPFTLEVQDPGGRTSDTVNFYQRSYLPAGAALPLIRRSAIRTENFFGGDDGGSYDSWEEFREYTSFWQYQRVRPNYRGRTFCSPGN